MWRMLMTVLLVPLALAAGGCADWEYRRSHGLEWRQFEIQQDRELIRQGFSPYSAPD